MKKIYHIQELVPFRHKPNLLLGVFAHPDDESLRVGGTFALAHKEHIPYMHVTLTQGEQGGKFSGIYGKKLGTLRTRELRHAAAILSIPTIDTLQFPDKGVSQVQEQVVNSIARVIAQHKPTIIVTHDLFDPSQHPDHIATAQAVVSAVHRVDPSWPYVVLFAGLSMNKNRTNYALDVAAYQNEKVQACLSHVSQGLFHGKTMPVPVQVYYALHHFEYFIRA